MTLSCSFISSFCVIFVGFLFLRKVIPWLYQNIIGPTFLGSKVNFRALGEWALITGATDGIGKAYANQLAKKGLNIILVSRSQEKLNNVAKEIESKYNVETKTIAVDFTHGPEIYERIERIVHGLEIGVLVNNVGISYPFPDYFLDIAGGEKFLPDIIACNVTAVIRMCRIVMPGMVGRRLGAVINVSSLTAKVPNPLLSVYSATKAFVDKFSGDLASEYKNKNIIVQSVMPGYVATNMSQIKKPTWMAPSADTFVESALSTVGLADHTTGYFPHALLILTIQAIKFFATDSIGSNVVFSQLIKIRNRALRRQAH